MGQSAQEERVKENPTLLHMVRVSAVSGWSQRQMKAEVLRFENS